ncbi:2-oxo acid dehydrogenase subunit E2 [Streptomyces hawaiiensis]|uniref:2-oxo acid dehydrogenase subunit E2 n=1 Tax=Streptomyces hawaiiensis TaxID=67305 RepID=UPI003CCC77BA
MGRQFLLAQVAECHAGTAYADLARDSRGRSLPYRFSARRDAVPAAHLAGGTFTLNNYGPLGVDGATPILNHPQTAMLGFGRLVDRPWAVDGRVEVRKVVHLSLTFDHRGCDGGTAAGFLRHVIARITAAEDPATSQ